MGTIKDRNGMGLTQTEDIKKMWQEYKEELFKKVLHDQDNHDGVITHLEPDIVECEVKRAWKGNGNLKLDLEKAEGTEIKLPTSVALSKM